MAESNTKIEIGESDRELFWLLLQQKFLTLELLLQRFAPQELILPVGKKGPFYYRLYRMVQAGYLKQHPYQTRKKVYALAQLGWETLSEQQRQKLPLIQPEDLATIRHDLIAAELRFYFEALGGLGWSADREFRPYASVMPCNPDGAIVLKGKDCFLEVELTQKSKERYDAIAAVYTDMRGPSAVLYFFENDTVVAYLQEKVAVHPRMAFFRYSSPLPPPEQVEGWHRQQPTTLASFFGLAAHV